MALIHPEVEFLWRDRTENELLPNGNRPYDSMSMKWTRRKCLALGALLIGGLLGLVPMATTRTSRAVFSPEKEVSPTIEITGRSITVQHRKSGSGEVRGTALRGERTYRFSRDGSYEVEPGRYQHIVYGQVPSGGSIESFIRYQ